MNKIWLPFIILFTFNFSNAQNFLNLGFEYGTYNAQPRKWMIEGEASEYGASLDSQTTKQGTKSLSIRLVNGSVYTYLMLSGKEVKGKKIIVQGYVRSNETDSLQVMLAFRDPAGKTTASQPVFVKAGNWTQLRHESQVPENYNADRFLIAVIAMGSGKYWLDDFTITLNEKPYGDGGPDFREPTAVELKALNKNAISLDLNYSEQIHSVIGLSKIVALGENSHGSASVFKYKLDLIKLLVEKGGFSVFALESPKKNAEIINRYVLNDTIDEQQAVQNLVHPIWQRQEMLDIIEWIKSYNQTNARKVEFKGFDINPGDNQENRETELAKNIDSILNSSNNRKIIISGDNSHITKASGKMGAFLKENYGDNYLNVGFTFQSGAYYAYGTKNEYAVHPAYIGTYEYFFSKAKFKNFIVDLRIMKDLPILIKTAGFRSIGSRPQDVTQFQETDILKNFDVIVNLEKSVPTTPWINRNK